MTNAIVRTILGKKKAKKKPERVNHYKGWILDRSIDATTIISPFQFTTISVWQNNNPNSEISGYGVLDQEGVALWVGFTSIGNQGFVENEAQSELEAIVAASPYGDINMHWHTHPGMGPFYSTTDEEHHAKRVRLNHGSLDITYVVFDGVFAVARRVVHDGKETRYNDGRVFIEDSEVPLEEFPTERKRWGFSYSYPEPKALYKEKKLPAKQVDDRSLLCDKCISYYCFDDDTSWYRLASDNEPCDLCARPVESGDSRTLFDMFDKAMVDGDYSSAAMYLDEIEDEENPEDIINFLEKREGNWLADTFLKRYETRKRV